MYTINLCLWLVLFASSCFFFCALLSFLFGLRVFLSLRRPRLFFFRFAHSLFGWRLEEWRKLRHPVSDLRLDPHNCQLKSRVLKVSCKVPWIPAWIHANNCHNCKKNTQLIASTWAMLNGLPWYILCRFHSHVFSKYKFKLEQINTNCLGSTCFCTETN